MKTIFSIGFLAEYIIVIFIKINGFNKVQKLSLVLYINFISSIDFLTCPG